MANAKNRPRARFAPIPIETTFERYRKTIPPGELTPSPSPRSPSPPLREKRRFAPQLVESSVRRSRRAGDEGPATKPTDKTDITPYTNHIYAPKARKRFGHGVIPGTSAAPKGHGRRESCDDEIALGFFDLVARDAQTKLQEVALSAFPNSGQRIGGAEHFYVRDGSDDDSLRGRPLTRGPWDRMHSRRNSSEEDISWAFKEMQEHAQKGLHRAWDRDRVDTLDLDNMSIESPPSDAMGLTRTQRTSIASSPLWTARLSSGSLDPIGFGRHSPFVPYVQERDMSLERARQQHRLRLKSPPPMLGTDLTFRMCPSPKQTKLEPDHLWNMKTGTAIDESNRDPTEQRGLWRGYCFTENQAEKLAPAERPVMITTPLPPGSPADPFAHQFGLTAPITLSEEPTPPNGGTTRAGSLFIPRPASGPPAGLLVPVSNQPPFHHPEHRTRSHEPKGLHMLQNLQNLDEKLRKEKAAADLEDKIAAEFDDRFVTQVYNYLSLGYPATARQFDEELSKISRIGVEELERDDEAIMENFWRTKGGADDGDGDDGEDGDGEGEARKKRRKKKQMGPTGHIMLDREEKDGVREEDRCQRWKALKLYVYEWARQHPDLNAISPLAWGVRERRGSWGV